MKKMGNHSSMLRMFLMSLFFMFSVSSVFAQEGDPANGKSVFNTNCAACHSLDKPMTGPPLRGVSERLDREWLHKWIKNSMELIKSGDDHANKIYAEYKNLPMPPFPQLSEKDIDDIIAYTAQKKEEPKTETVVAGAATSGASGDSDSINQIIFGALAVVLLVLVIALYAIRKGLRNVAQAKGVDLEENKPSLCQAFLQNKFLVFVTVIFLLLTSAYFGYGYMMQVGIDKGYKPIQPIHYSHKIHAGDNQIDCKYCHSSARSSKTSGIPSLNVCMNCHMNISEYTGEEDLANGYTKEFYTAEIQKLYDAVGWDPSSRTYSKPQQPVKWVRIHNLPDFVYFNHSQHVTVAGLECQKCHGEVEKMEILEQHATLTMGWCVECHRTTDVKTEGNEYYKKMHDELAKKYGVEKLTVAQMGGLECGKCHY